MKLKQAMRVAPGECIAFIGAGGKTTALFTLARELNSQVIVTTTTHFGLDQLSLADQNLKVEESTEIKDVLDEFRDEVLLIRDEQEGEDKAAGIPEDKLVELFHAARERKITLLIEADGSRRLPLKAPASHEPVIPPYVDRVVVVAGLSALGKPLRENWVHRIEQFAEISGLEPGEPISQSAIVDVLINLNGGRKGIPPEAKRMVLLNQADDPGLQSQGNSLARRLIEHYDSVVVASLKPRHESIDALPVDQPIGKGKVFAAHEPIAAVILAAGKAARMGRTKQLLPWKGKPLLWHVAQAASGEGIKEVFIVIGAEGEMIRESLHDLQVRFIENPDWENGQSTSLKAGLAAQPEQTGGVIFLLADQPQVSPMLIRALIERHASTLAPIVAPLVDGERGNPVLFDRFTFDDLMGIQGDTGGREIFSRYSVEWLEWHDARALLDVDTEDDYQRLLSGDF